MSFFIMSFTKVVVKGLLGPIVLGLMVLGLFCLPYGQFFYIFSVYILLVVGM